MKKIVWPLVLILLAGLLSACSGESANAGEPLEAASVEWTEAELKKVDDKVSGLDSRTDELQREIDALLAQTPGTGGGSEPVFLDVQPDYWAFKEIMTIYDAGIISGYPDIQKFLPEKSITRAQAASMLVKALKLPLSDAPSAFSDMSSDHWAYKQIMTVAEKGYFRGSNGKFLPNDPMTRKHMAVVLQRAFDLQVTSDPYQDYKDVPKTDDGYLYIKAITQHDVARGSDGYYRPYESTKRSQFSVFLYRALNY
ncbi:S-layer homology domain-containing protein [Cytobacillus oceanisediminis]|uniref:S-layer homology domain-containing protein n=1 Tax=Cytobacillus oceanisediminis TaxID=665099 RepID=UPI0037351C97